MDSFICLVNLSCSRSLIDASSQPITWLVFTTWSVIANLFGYPVIDTILRDWVKASWSFFSFWFRTYILWVWCQTTVKFLQYVDLITVETWELIQTVDCFTDVPFISSVDLDITKGLVWSKCSRYPMFEINHLRPFDNPLYKGEINQAFWFISFCRRYFLLLRLRLFECPLGISNIV